MYDVPRLVCTLHTVLCCHRVFNIFTKMKSPALPPNGFSLAAPRGPYFDGGGVYLHPTRTSIIAVCESLLGYSVVPNLRQVALIARVRRTPPVEAHTR